MLQSYGHPGDVIAMSQNNWIGEDSVTNLSKKMVDVDVFSAGFECDDVCKIARTPGSGNAFSACTACISASHPYVDLCMVCWSVLPLFRAYMQSFRVLAGQRCNPGIAQGSTARAFIKVHSVSGPTASLLLFSASLKEGSPRCEIVCRAWGGQDRGDC